MKNISIALFVAMLPSAAFCADAPAQKVEPLIKLSAPAPAAGPEMTEQQQALYGLGIWLAQKVETFHLTADELKTVEAGWRDGVLGRKLQVDLNSVGSKINELAKQRYEAALAKQKSTAKTLLDKAAKEKGAQVLPSGVVLQTIKAGKGESPKDADTAKFNMRAAAAGKIFQDTYATHQPAEAAPSAAGIKCLQEGLELMKPGGKAKLTCPSDTAFGDKGNPPEIPGGAAAIFELELLSVTKALTPEQQKVAEQKAAVGQKAALEKAAKEPGAVKLPSGVVFRSLQDGSGASPKPADTVKVNYKGTLIDGKVFDSSYQRNAPATFGLNQVIPCWTEGVQKIKVGGKAKLTCPAETAYGDHGPPGIGNGATLTFEVELLDILKQ